MKVSPYLVLLAKTYSTRALTTGSNIVRRTHRPGRVGERDEELADRDMDLISRENAKNSKIRQRKLRSAHDTGRGPFTMLYVYYMSNICLLPGICLHYSGAPTASVCSSSKTPSLWSTRPLTILPGHVKQLPDMQELGSSRPASIAASSKVVSSSQFTSWMAPSHSIFTFRTRTRTIPRTISRTRTRFRTARCAVRGPKVNLLAQHQLIWERTTWNKRGTILQRMLKVVIQKCKKVLKGPNPKGDTTNMASYMTLLYCCLFRSFAGHEQTC